MKDFKIIDTTHAQIHKYTLSLYLHFCSFLNQVFWDVFFFQLTTDHLFISLLFPKIAYYGYSIIHLYSLTIFKIFCQSEMLYFSHNYLIFVPKSFPSIYLYTCCFIFLEILVFLTHLPFSSLSNFSSLMKCQFLRGYFSDLTDWVPSFRVPALNPNPYHTPVYPWNVSLIVTNSEVFTLVYIGVNTPSLFSYDILYLFSYYFHSLYLTICVNFLFFFTQ